MAELGSQYYNKPVFVLTRVKKAVQRLRTFYRGIPHVSTLRWGKRPSVKKFGGHPYGSRIFTGRANIEEFRRQLNRKCYWKNGGRGQFYPRVWIDVPNRLNI